MSSLTQEQLDRVMSLIPDVQVTRSGLFGRRHLTYPSLGNTALELSGMPTVVPIVEVLDTDVIVFAKPDPSTLNVPTLATRNIAQQPMLSQEASVVDIQSARTASTRREKSHLARNVILASAAAILLSWLAPREENNTENVSAGVAPTSSVESVTTSTMAVAPTTTTLEVTTTTSAPTTTMAPETTVTVADTIPALESLSSRKGQYYGNIVIPALCIDGGDIYVDNQVINPPEQSSWTRAQRTAYRLEHGDPRDILHEDVTPDNCQSAEEFAKDQRDNGSSKYKTRAEAGNNKYRPIFVIYPSGVQPGQEGTVALGGHNTESSGPTREIYSMQNGDIIEVTGTDGRVHKYQVVNKGVVIKAGHEDTFDYDLYQVMHPTGLVSPDGTLAKQTLVIEGCGTVGVVLSDGTLTTTNDALYVQAILV